MAWVVEGVTLQVCRRFGSHLGHEWPEFGRLLGVRFQIASLPDWLPALRVGTTIVLRRGMAAFETAWWAWHELAHVLMHPGNVLCPIGRQDQGKQERQANEFAALYPLWDAPDVTFCADPVTLPRFCVESEARFVNCLWGGGV